MPIQHLRFVVFDDLLNFTVQFLDTRDQRYPLFGEPGLRIGLKLGVNLVNLLVLQHSLKLGRQCAYGVGLFNIRVGIFFNLQYVIPDNPDCPKLCCT